jgi:hypothetical protein
MSWPARASVDRKESPGYRAPKSVARLAILSVGDRTHLGQVQSISAPCLYVRLYEHIPEGDPVVLRTGYSPAMRGKVACWENSVARIDLDQPLGAEALNNINAQLGID